MLTIPILNHQNLIPINSTKSAIEALDHDDAGIRYHSAWWLGKHRAAEAVAKLIECLQDEREVTSSGGYPLRRQAARSLGMIKDASCVDALLETLQTDDVQLHEATLRALIELDSDQCTHSLITYLNKDIQNKPIEALIETLTSYHVWEVSEQIKPFLESDSERIASSAASYFFILTGEQKYLEKITSLLSNNNRFVRQSAAFDLARIGTIEATEPVLSAKIPNNVKMHVIKAILSESLKQPDSDDKAKNCGGRDSLNSLFNTLDDLTKENFAGNLLIDQSTQLLSRPENKPTSKEEIISAAFTKLRSPSLSDREKGIQQLIESAKSVKANLSGLYFSEPDQDIRMGLIKAMSELKDIAYVPALVDAIGVEIGNHCQGNIRRVAACALGEIDWSQHFNCQSFSDVIDKLNWTLQYPDDWGLRYSACIALEGISNSKAKALLLQTKSRESDPVISNRIDIALSRMNETHGDGEPFIR